MNKSTHSIRFIMEISLWCLIVGPLAVALPWPFLLPMFYIFGGPPALLGGICLGLRYRSRPIPDSFFRRALNGAQAGAVSTGIYFGAAGLIAGRVTQDNFVLGVLGFAAIGAFAGAVAFAVIPTHLRRFEL
jgi:hypothetical protein